MSEKQQKQPRVTVMRLCSCPRPTSHWHVGHDIDGCCTFNVPPFRLSLWVRREDGIKEGKSLFSGFRGARALRKKYFSAFERVVENLWQTLPKGEFVDITDKVPAQILEGYLEDLRRISTIPRKKKIEL